MRKRLFILGGFAAALATVGSKKAEAAKTQYVVPKGVTRINVKSWSPEGEKVMNYSFNVEEGQKFEITPVNK